MTPEPEVLAHAIEDRWKQFLQQESSKRQAQTKRPYAYASAWRACNRRMVLEATEPAKLPPWPPEVLARFRRGEDRERDLLMDLARIGRDATPAFKVMGQQERFELKDHQDRVVIVGKVDARLDLGSCRPPLEVKAWSPLIVDRLQSFHDVLHHPFTRQGGFQLLSYLYGAGEAFGFLLLDRSGLPLLLPVKLEAHLDDMEAFLVKAQTVRDHIEAGTLPDYHDDPGECKRCPWFGAECQPPLAGDGAAVVLTDPDLEATLARREELKAAADEFDDLDKKVKQQLRGVEFGVAGPFQIRGKWSKTTRTQLPPDIKDKYTITDSHGRFTLDITKL